MSRDEQVDAPPAPTEEAAPEPARGSGGGRGLGGTGWALVSAVLALLLWYLGTAVLGPRVLPPPLAVLGAIPDAYRDGYLISDMVTTFGRVLGAFAIALVVGTVLGILLGRVTWVRGVFAPWQRVLASVPALLVAVVVYLTMGLNNTAAMVATALIVMPNIVYTSWAGVTALDPGLGEMARVFVLRRQQVVRHIVLPQLSPYVFAAARLGLSLSWKLMVFVELLGQSSGVGYRIQYWYQIFDMERVLASALPFILIMVFIDSVLLTTIERKAFRWRRQEL